MAKKGLLVKGLAGILVIFLSLGLVPLKALAAVTPGQRYQTLSRIICLTTPQTFQAGYYCYIIRYTFVLKPSLKNGPKIEIRIPQPERAVGPQPQPAPEPRPKPEPQPQPQLAQELTEEERQMIDLVNAERVKAGLKPLQVDMRLVVTARAKSRDMVVNNYFGHQSSTLGSPFDQMRKAGIAYRYAGENLAGAPSVTSAHKSLMNSPGHRANILNPNFTHIGIGIVSGGPYGKMFTQHFIGL
ncbi:MAG: hypothetical protein PWP65_71 [Clostridia bacterium]|nr:hypothetical protein [Clostridia bacterium]